VASKSYSVVLTEGAEHDLESIYDYIAAFDSIRSANYVLDRLTDAMGRLSRFPERGTYPKELIALGMREFRQIAFKPYRVIYRVHELRVVIYLVADGRRDMQTLLARRLLGASGDF
jgi:toxin ParE1/3/4